MWVKLNREELEGLVWTEEIKQKDLGRLGRQTGNYSLMFGLVTICRNTSGQRSRDKRPR